MGWIGAAIATIVRPRFIQPNGVCPHRLVPEQTTALGSAFDDLLPERDIAASKTASDSNWVRLALIGIGAVSPRETSLGKSAAALTRA